MTAPSSTTDPVRAGSFPAKAIAPKRIGKKKPCFTRSTTRTNQAWKHVREGAGHFQPFKCPRCNETIVYDKRGFVGCGSCEWSPREMTQKERSDLEARDPEMAPIFQFLERMEQHAPLFEGHANKKQISGKERREKRFLSKCAAVR